MRCFSLKILNSSDASSSSNKLVSAVKEAVGLSSILKDYAFGMSNPCGLGIKFNISYYTDPITATIPNTIELFNAESDLYLNAKSYIGKKIIFSAGFENSVLAMKCGFKNSHISMNTLLQGAITNIVPNYSSFTQPSVIISFMGDFPKPVDKLKSSAFRSFPLILDGPSINITKITEWLKNFIPTGFVISTDPSAYAAMTLTASSIKLEAKSFYQAAERLEELGIFCKMSDNVITLSYISPDADALGTTSVTAVGAKGLSTIISAAGLENTIEPEEMVSQPQIISLVETQVTTMLRGDIKLGSRIKLSGKIKPSLSSIDFTSINSFGNYKGLEVFSGGKFTVTGVNHIGDSRNSSPDSWVTSLKLVRG